MSKSAGMPKKNASGGLLQRPCWVLKLVWIESASSAGATDGQANITIRNQCLQLTPVSRWPRPKSYTAFEGGMHGHEDYQPEKRCQFATRSLPPSATW